MPGTILPFEGVWPKIAEDAFIAETAVVIGDVEIGPGSSIWYGCVVRGDVNRIRIGARTNIQDGTILHVNHDPEGSYRETGGGMPTHIGDDVTVGHMALLHACTIETGGFVGMRAVVMDQATVEGGAMIAAGALVTPNKRVPAGELWSGSPAKKMRDLTQQERDYIPYSAQNYARLAADYLRARGGVQNS
jgi:carbonic anhydrase/acetyltransferase-like protein (isoleucine patch superfamily)